MILGMDMRVRALQALMQCDPDQKALAVQALHHDWLAARVGLDRATRIAEPLGPL